MSNTLETAFGPTIEKTLDDMRILLVPAASPTPGENLVVYSLNKDTGQPLSDEQVLDLSEVLHEFSIDYTPLNPGATLIAIRYGASSAVVQQAIDRLRADEFSGGLTRELTAEEIEQYYRLLVYDFARWEYIMDVDGAFICADLADLQRPLRRMLDHLNQLEISYRVQHVGHHDMLIISDEAAAQRILRVRNGLYQKIAVHNPKVIDLARHLTNYRVLLPARASTDKDPGLD